MCCLFSCTLQGAPESIIDRCNFIRVGSKKQPLTPKIKQQILELVKQYGTGVYASVNAQTLADSVEMMFAVFYMRVYSKINLHPPYSDPLLALLRVYSFGIIPVSIYDLRSIGLWCIKGFDESLSTWDQLVPFMHHDSIDLDSFILIQINPKECRVLSPEQRSLTERTISALAKGKSYTFVGQGQNEEACVELKLMVLFSKLIWF